MSDFLRFFSSERFMPHGHCYLWREDILWLHILSDAGIALAYFAIPVVLFYFIRQRRDIPYPWMFVLFGLFIFACGGTHLFGIYTIWHPEYALEGLLKAGTAVISLATAALLVPLVPKALALEGPAGLEQKVNERTLELKKLNEALRSSEARGRLLIEAAPNGMIMVGSDGRIVLLNSQIEKLFGYGRDELLGQNIGILLPERFNERHAQYRQSYFDDPQSRAMGAGRDLFGRRKDGSEFPVEIGLNPLRIDEGAFVLAAVVDITSRKLAEEELRKARDEAESASLAKSSFLANMSHEIRTPLNGVFGMLGLLLDSRLNESQREYAETALISAETLLRLINDILDFSTIEAGRLNIEPVAFDLRNAVGEAAEILAVRAEERGIDLAVRFDQDLPTEVVGDPGRIGQVLTNLVSNAIRFTEKGHVLINVEATSMSGSPEQGTVDLRFEVSDTGIGIEEDQLERVFEKFVQKDSSSTRKFSGAGLGLAISRELVELMGGEIGARSRPGEGSTFWFTLRLPCVKETGPEVRKPRQLEGLRILVADDQAANRSVIVEQVTAWGMRASVCSGGKAAFAALCDAQAQDDPFRFAIVDQQMPEMDGEQFGQLISGYPDLSNTILIALTSTGMTGDPAKFEKAGFKAYLVRPVRAPELMVMLETLWSAHLEGRSIGLLTRRSLVRSAGRREAKQSRPAGSTRARVLVAEDNTINQLVAVRMLRALGYQADVAADGVEVLQMVSAAPYDLIFMDCQMPEMDGYQATREIRRREQGAPGIPIIAMTAHALEGEREKCINAGMNDYLSKPVLLENFEQMLDKYLRTTPTR
jgi:two-component system sensor histidine kinase/response regulator